MACRYVGGTRADSDTKENVYVPYGALAELPFFAGWLASLLTSTIQQANQPLKLNGWMDEKTGARIALALWLHLDCTM